MKLIIESSHKALICFDFDDGRNESSVYKIESLLSQFINTDVGFISKKGDLGGSTVEQVKDFFLIMFVTFEKDKNNVIIKQTKN